MSARTGHLQQHLQEVKEHTSEELPSTLQHAHTSVFTDEEMGGDASSSTTTKVNPDSLGSPRNQENSIDANTTYGKWGEGRSSRLPWDEADKEYRPSPSPRNSAVPVDVRDEPHKKSCTDTIWGMPKWLLILLSLFLLSLALAMLISGIRGYNMVVPHVQIVNFQFPLPYPYSDATGSIPVISTMLFSNFNKFGFTTWPGDMRIYALPSRSPASLLATGPVNSLQLAPHQKGQALQSFFQIANINGVDGGRFLTNAIVQGDVNYLYTTSVIRIRVRALGLIPITRSYKNDCTVMKRWGTNPLTTSDCYRHFV